MELAVLERLIFVIFSPFVYFSAFTWLVSGLGFRFAGGETKRMSSFAPTTETYKQRCTVCHLFDLVCTPLLRHKRCLLLEWSLSKFDYLTE